jgi:hypothetical protein
MTVEDVVDRSDSSGPELVARLDRDLELSREDPTSSRRLKPPDSESCIDKCGAEAEPCVGELRLLLPFAAAIEVVDGVVGV